MQRIMLIQESKKAKAKRQVLHGGHEGRIITSEIVLSSGKLVVTMEGTYNATFFGVRPVICIMQE